MPNKWWIHVCSGWAVFVLILLWSDGLSGLYWSKETELMIDGMNPEGQVWKLKIMWGQALMLVMLHTTLKLQSTQWVRSVISHEAYCIVLRETRDQRHIRIYIYTVYVFCTIFSYYILQINGKNYKLTTKWHTGQEVIHKSLQEIRNSVRNSSCRLP